MLLVLPIALKCTLKNAAEDRQNVAKPERETLIGECIINRIGMPAIHVLYPETAGLVKSAKVERAQSRLSLT